MDLSITKIKAFKSCRRLYQLRYVEGLSPVEKPEPLETGASYHKLVEAINNGVDIVGNPDFEGDFSKEVAMARAYERFIFPRVHVVEAEKALEYDLGGGDRLIGIADGVARDGRIVEHKTTGSEITEQYEYRLMWDEQILAYMLMTGARKAWYTVCRKPSIRIKKDETDEAFFYRMLSWYEWDTESKIRLLEIERTDEEVESFRKGLLEMRDEMKRAEAESVFYRNTCHCNTWGWWCEYAGVCLHYDPAQEYIGFIKEER